MPAPVLCAQGRHWQQGLVLAYNKSGLHSWGPIGLTTGGRSIPPSSLLWKVPRSTSESLSAGSALPGRHTVVHFLGRVGGHFWGGTDGDLPYWATWLDTEDLTSALALHRQGDPPPALFPSSKKPLMPAIGCSGRHLATTSHTGPRAAQDSAVTDAMKAVLMPSKRK